MDQPTYRNFDARVQDPPDGQSPWVCHFRC